MLVGGLNVLIPAFLLIDMARQRMRKSKGCTEGDTVMEDSDFLRRFTPFGVPIVKAMLAWRWANTLWWVCMLGHIYFVWQVVVSKVTYIFLSWLNAQLSMLPYGTVIVINFFVGIIMFLLPPVPGVAVYLFTGIVIAEQGRQNPSVGFVSGCVIAVVLCFFLKMMACCAQYSLGYFMGKSVRVQALVGVDKVFTRAMEEILMKPGLSLGKVSVLVGGPDWPVSVGCGILKVDVLQMLVGTAPVMFVLAPSVLAGAFQARVGVGEGSFFNMGVTMLTSASVVIQIGAGLVAVMCVMNVVGASGERLAKPRKEHEAVEELTRKEEEYNKVFQEVTMWSKLSMVHKVLISLAAFLAIVSGFIFAFFGSSCFENFSISSKINNPIAENGLNGDIFNIIILPQAAVPLVLYALSAVLHILFVLETARLTRAAVKDRGDVAQAPGGSPASKRKVLPQTLGNTGDT